MNLATRRADTPAHRLEKAGLVVGRHEVSEDGKALRYYTVADFDEHLTPERISQASKTISTDGEAGAREER